jgi:hypothetical protein
VRAGERSAWKEGTQMSSGQTFGWRHSTRRPVQMVRCTASFRCLQDSIQSCVKWLKHDRRRASDAGADAHSGKPAVLRRSTHSFSVSPWNGQRGA